MDYTVLCWIPPSMTTKFHLASIQRGNVSLSNSICWISVAINRFLANEPKPRPSPLQSVYMEYLFCTILFDNRPRAIASVRARNQASCNGRRGQTQIWSFSLCCHYRLSVRASSCKFQQITIRVVVATAQSHQINGRHRSGERNAAITLR